MRKKIKVTINVDEESAKRRCVHHDGQEPYYTETLPPTTDMSALDSEHLINKGIKLFDQLYQDYHTCECAYYKLKLFFPPDCQSSELNHRIQDIELGFEYVKRIFDNIKISYDYYLHSPQDDYEKASAFYIKSMDLNKVLADLTEEINNVKEHYFIKVRSAMHTITKDLTLDELKMLRHRLDSMLNEFLDLEQAYEFIYYHSSELMYDTVNNLILSLKDIGHTDYKMEQFLGFSYAFSLSYMEWMNMFNRIHSAMALFPMAKPSRYTSFKKNYDELIIRYIVYVIWYEEYGE